VPREYLVQCWSCLGEFDAGAAVWCTCNPRTATKLCPFCFHCFCQADIEYQDAFWNAAPGELREEHALLRDAKAPIGERLIRSNLLNTDQLVSALKWQQNRGGSVDDAIVDLGFVPRDKLDLVAQGRAPDTSTIDLSKGLIDASLVKEVGVEICWRKRILPVSREEIGEKPVLTLAMAGPTDVETIDQIQSLTNCTIIPMSAPEPEIARRLADLFPDEVTAMQAADPDRDEVQLTSGRQRAAAPARPGRRAAARSPAPTRSPAAAGAAGGDPLAIDEEPPAGPARGAGGRQRTRGGAAPAPSTLEEIDALAPDPQPARRPARPRPRPAPAVAAEPAAGSGEDAGAVLQKVLAEAIAKRASSIQVELRGGDLSLFFRIDGNLYRARPPALATPEALARAIVARASIPAAPGPASGRITVKAGAGRIDLVVRRLPSPGGESLLLKVIDRARFVQPLDDLGPSRADLQKIRHGLAQETGLVLLCGPPHNGVESTRYSLLAWLAAEGRRVSSVESPLLLPIEGARQEEVPVPPEAAAVRAAAEALAGTEILFLPEIAAPPMAAQALERAGTCLVVASIQARRASQAAAAFLWHRVDAGELGRRLRLVVGQRLVRRICAGCRTAQPVADKVLKMMGLTPDESLDLKVFQGSGCDRCGPLSPGYAGRVALFEVIEKTPEIAALVAAGAQPGELEREARRSGMSPLRAACLALVGQGITTLEEFQKGNF
jgi:type II secretory ATPase GspE/PulE/Tfp pilus assembly ATPase PilB-like protein